LRGRWGDFFLVFKNTLLKGVEYCFKKHNNGGKIIEVKNGGSACKMPSNKNQEILLGSKNKIK
jgi:hypothetical protein